MTWQRRMRELALAGGTLLAAGCGMQSCCNANPDPCCAAPSGRECQDSKDCVAAGGEWGGQVLMCEFPPDLSGELPDASVVDAAKSD